MIIVGDVAISRGDRFRFEGFKHLADMPLCMNLEGAVLEPSSGKPSWGVYNSEDFLGSLGGFNLACIFLANNHIHDVPQGVESTIDRLRANGLEAFGAGLDESQASRPAQISSGADSFVLLGYGWPVIGCKSASRKSAGVSIFEGRSVSSQLELAIREHPDVLTVVVIHGNYEFEPYPQPGHRKLAKTLIDSGAYAVIFHHPHIVGPVERYKGRTIAYSLGNWAFSYGKFFGGKLKFPPSSFHQIAVELSSEGDKLHHAIFEPPTTVRYERTELVADNELSLKAEFEGFDDKQYIQWFKANRVKRKGLPVYASADASIGNSLRDTWVGARQLLIDSAAKIGLKKIRRS